MKQFSLVFLFLVIFLNSQAQSSSKNQLLWKISQAENSLEFLTIERPKPKLELLVDSVLAFQCLLPAGIKETVRMKDLEIPAFSNDPARQHIFLHEDDKNNELYSVFITRYPTGWRSKDDSLYLANTATAFKQKLGDPTILLDTTYFSQDVLTREIRFLSGVNQPYNGWIKYRIRSTRLYTQLALHTSKATSENIKQFMGSLTLLPLKHSDTDSWHQYQDEKALYELAFPTASPLINHIFDKKANMALSIEDSYSIADQKTIFSMDSLSDLTYLLSHTRYSDYIQVDDLDSLYIRILNIIQNNESKPMSIYDTTFQEYQGIRCVEYKGKYLKTNDHFIGRLILKGRHMISTEVNLPEGEIDRAAADYFFNSLDLSKVPEDDFFGKQTQNILEGLHHRDTFEYHLARRALYQYEFEKEEDSPELLKAFQQNYAAVSDTALPTLAILGDNLAYMGETKMLPIIEKRYPEFSSDPYMQIEFLEDLAILNTRESAILMASLLQQPPQAYYSLLGKSIRAMNESEFASVLVPSVYQLLADSIWWYDAISFQLGAADSNLISLDTAQLFNEKVLYRGQQIYDSLQYFIQNPDTSDTYFSHPYFDYVIRGLKYMTYEPKAYQLLRKFENDLRNTAWLLYPVCSAIMKHGEIPEQASIDSLAANQYWLMDIADLLQSYEQLDLLPASYRTQLSLAYSYLTNYIDEGIGSSYELLEKREIEYQGQKGWVYQISIGFEGYEGTYISFCGLFDKDETLLGLNKETLAAWWEEEALTEDLKNEYWNHFIESLEEENEQ